LVYAKVPNDFIIVEI